MAAGTGARRMLPSLSRVHFPYSSMGWTRVSSHSPLRVSVTVQDCGCTTPSPLPEKSVQAAGYTQINGNHLTKYKTRLSYRKDVFAFQDYYLRQHNCIIAMVISVSIKPSPLIPHFHMLSSLRSHG